MRSSTRPLPSQNLQVCDFGICYEAGLEWANDDVGCWAGDASFRKKDIKWRDVGKSYQCHFPFSLLPPIFAGNAPMNDVLSEVYRRSQSVSVTRFCLFWLAALRTAIFPFTFPITTTRRGNTNILPACPTATGAWVSCHGEWVPRRGICT